MRIRVTVRDKVGGDFVTRELKRIKVGSDLDLKHIAETCEGIIQDTIMTKADKPTGHLASLMIAEKIPNGWGVGDIDTLDKDAPYWNHIDKGSEGIGANWEHYLPKGFWQNGRWVVSDKGFSGIKPKTPIPAMNFIAITLQRMESYILKILKGL